MIASQEDKELSQEELLQQTVYVQHRPLKDPRDIKMLDPACGSMHFGLYAFDLFEKIYSEAWDLEESNAQGGFVREDSDKTPSGNVLQSLHHAYNSKDAFLADVPRLIIEHNIHGVDIDPRAVQIAGLSLWLRAQRSWSGNAIHPNKRPQIQRSNIVCAEPMPGEKELLKEFASQIQPRVLGQLVEEIFDKMQLAGEAGTLLKIEEEIQTAIDEAKAQKNEGGHWEQGGLFGKNKWEVRDGTRYNFDGNISDDFWDQAEFLMLAELERYAESSTGEGSIQKRLFALDAAKGFSFIDLCRKRFDVVLMNPPFGDISFNIIDFIKEKYAEEKQEFYSCFITNASNQLLDTGMLGVICGRPAFYAEGLEEWRHKTLNNFHCSEFLDLGGGVLDAMVETVASCWSKNKENNYIDFFRVNGEEDKGDALAEILSNNLAASRYLFPEAALNKIPKSTFAYWLPAHIVNWFTDLPRMCDIEFDVKIGIQTDNDFRYSRLHWEVPMSEKAYVENVENVDWNSLYFEECKNKTWAVQLKGSESNPFFVDFPLLVNWRGNGAELKAQTIAKFGNYGKRIYNEYVFFRSGFSWSIRTDYFSPHMVPPGTIPTVSRYLAVAKEGIDSLSVIAKLNTALYEVLVRTRMGKWTQPLYMSGVIEGLPCINDPLINERLHKLSVEAVKILEMAYSHEETSNYYRGFQRKIS